MLFGRIVLILLLVEAAISAADWNAAKAAAYLDSRQKEWAAWAPAQLAPGEACLSCHTGMTYLLARPVLRGMLGEMEPTGYEAAALRGVQKRIAKTTGGELAGRYEKEPRASQAISVEAVLAAFLLSRADAGKPELSPETRQAFDRLWKLQKREGDRKGAWAWFELNDDPYEGDASPFFGASLAAVAVGNTPAAYRKTAEPQIAALREYLRAHLQGQPLHHRLILAWAAHRLPGLIPEAEKRAIVEEALSRQEPDGGWKMASLGSWPEHPAAKPSIGSNAYATAITAFALEQAGLPTSDPKLKAALSWLRTHQDPQTGTWQAQSMNKVYPAGSMQENFMRDTATAFAVLALAGADKPGARLISSGE